MRYAILDLETTGGAARIEKITEVAIILYEDGEVLEEYESLVNPERTVPPFVARMTGLTDKVLADAPKFYEIAREIVEITDGATIVAHNARFDYAFLQSEFRRLGFTFSRKRLCTLELSRRLLPHLPKYGLDALTKHFDIPIQNRHRAMGDTRATLILFEKLIEIQKGINPDLGIHKLGIQTSKIPRGMTREQLESLPEACGVYFFEDEDGDYLYIGKSINIKKRIFQHLNEMNKKSQEMQRRTTAIDAQLTGSELACLLLESRLIKKYHPPLNKAQRSNRYPFALVQYEKNGYQAFRITKKPKEGEIILDQCAKSRHARNKLAKIVEQNDLCPMLSGLERMSQNSSCKMYKYDACMGACMQEEDPDLYNIRAQEAIHYLDNSFESDFLLIDSGRSEEERSVFLVQDGHYRGMAYIDMNEAWTPQDMIDQIEKISPNREYNSILRRYVRSGAGMERINLNRKDIVLD